MLHLSIKALTLNGEWWLIPIIPELGKQGSREFETNLGHRMRPSISQNKHKYHHLKKERIGKREEGKERKRGEKRREERFSICVNLTALGFLFQSYSGDSITQQDPTAYERLIHSGLSKKVFGHSELSVMCVPSKYRWILRAGIRAEGSSGWNTGHWFTQRHQGGSTSPPFPKCPVWPCIQSWYMWPHPQCALDSPCAYHWF